MVGVEVLLCLLLNFWISLKGDSVVDLFAAILLVAQRGWCPSCSRDDPKTPSATQLQVQVIRENPFFTAKLQKCLLF